ncbi:unnamed protein product, partial [Meganyctiphanes norvegica]
MSAICQTFVQNTWRKDLCSNCFKSEEEHGNNNCGIVFPSLPSGEDGGINEVSKSGRGSGRYMGVAGSVFQRSYYKQNSWKSIMIDNNDSGLKSPGLIKGMSNFISSENEKNIALSNTANPTNNNYIRSSGLYQHMRTTQSEAKLLSDFLDDNHEKEKDKGDLSSDLGSDGSPDVSVSSASSASPTSDVASGGTSSDTASLKSDQDSDHLEEYNLRRDLELELTETCKETGLSDLEHLYQMSKQDKVLGILKESRLVKSHQKSIIWKSEDQVIGYGGDVDYSDDEEYSDVDDDDDEDDETDLTPDERVLKRLTERNTIFNEENENLLKEKPDLKTVPCTRYEAPNKTYIVDSDNKVDDKKDENKNSKNYEINIQEEKKEEKSEPKVKLKRSPPLSSSVKPLISRNLNDIKVNQVLPMKNGEVIRPTTIEKTETIPLAGIKPKYVSMEDEMVEKIDHNELLSRQKEKLTSIDDVISNELDKKVTSLDDIVPNYTSLNDIQKTTSFDEIIANENTLHETTQQDYPTIDKPKVNEIIKYDEESPKKIISNLDNTTNKIKEKIMQEELREKSTDVQMTSSQAPVVPKPRLSKAKKVNNIPERRNTTTNKIMKFIQDDFKTNNIIERNHLSSSSPEIPTNVMKNEIENDITTTTSPQNSQIINSENQNLEFCELDKNEKEVSICDQGTSNDLENKLNISPDTEEIKKFDSNLTLTEDNISHKSISSQETYENPKIPASRQDSTSSFTTFGTPVVITPSTPQNSFLHQNSRGSMYDDIYGTTKSPIYTPAKDFLKEIKSQPEVSTPTAGIQKAALYASTSCLKGLPSKKPVLTPKPPILKEKPKIGYKTSVNGNRIYATPSLLMPKVSIGSLSSAVSSPSLFNVTGLKDKDTENSLTGIKNSPYNSHSDSRLNLQDSSIHEYKKPPPTTQAPAIPKTPPHSSVEAVYDVPVTLTSTPVMAAKTVTTQLLTPKVNDDVIYQEVDDVLKARLGISQTAYKREDNAYQVSDVSPVPAVPTSSPPALSPIVSTIERQESTRCQSRSTFEANRSLLSAALSFGNNTMRSSTSKRLAPQPPEEIFCQNESNIKDSSDELNQENSSNHNIPKDNNFITIPDNGDGESYSSFTDDFDDDDYEDDEDEQPTLKKAERSSSANPFYRNSIGPIHQYNPAATSGTTYGTSNVYVIPTGVSVSESNGKAATRSHSVPRVSEHIIKKDVSVAPVSASSTSSTKFSFGKSGFFQPSSSSNSKSDKQERGRDRTKKSSRFSLKKLLRIGSKDEDKKDVKLEAKKAEREAKKNKLQIIHPLDYNQNGVEVIARPEKTSPIYDYTGIYGYIPPPQQQKEEIYAALSTVTQITSASPVPSRYSYHSEENSQEPCFSLSPTPSIASTQPSTSSSQPISSFISSSSSCTSEPVLSSNSTGNILAPVPINSESVPQAQKHLEKWNSILKKDDISSRGLERRESIISHNSNGGAQSQTHLGYNSEGRPKPPPPPRKVSLEGGINEEAPYLEISSVSRPLRPPAPTRTPSNAGSKSGPLRPDPTKLTRDSVYANIGDVRAPITPRKPGRSASIRGDDDREKRRAPQPPSSSSSTRSSISSLRGSSKGPAPLRPQSQHSDRTPPSDGATESALNVDDSTSSSQKEKTSRVSVRRSSAVTHRSLEDQYGAVVSANHEALSNM